MVRLSGLVGGVREQGARGKDERLRKRDEG